MTDQADKHRRSYLRLIAFTLLIWALCSHVAFGQELVRKLDPLSVRGVNYYPRDTPWSYMWWATPVSAMDREMALAESLNVNAIRMFLSWNTDKKLIDEAGNVSNAYLNRFEQFLATAWKHHMRAVVCFDNWSGHEDAAWKKAMGTFVTKYKGDGRILMWDLINEPGGTGSLFADPKMVAFIRNSLDYIKSLDPDHLTTVGLLWQIEDLSKIKLPDVAQYHEYGVDCVGASLEGMMKYAPNHPIIIGEFGGNVHQGGDTEEKLAIRYGLILHAAEKDAIAGTMPWCLTDYTLVYVGEDNRFMGLFRADNSLRPAGQLLKQTYARWSHPCKHAFYDECHDTKGWCAAEQCVVEEPHADDSWFRQKLAGGTWGTLTSNEITADIKNHKWLTVVAIDISPGAIFSVEVLDQASTMKSKVITQVSEPGAYSYDLSKLPWRLQGEQKFKIRLHLKGSDGQYVDWDRIDISDSKPANSPAAPPSEFVLNPANGHYYHVVEVPGGVSFLDAQAGAERLVFNERSGHLATITSTKEMKFIADHFSAANGYWLGGFRARDDSESKEKWRWVTDEQWDYTNWQIGKTTLSDDSPYALKLGFPEWQCCSIEQSQPGYIAEFDDWKLGPELNPINGHYYEAVYKDNGVSWADAEKAAKSLEHMGKHGHLATITSEDEAKFISSRFYYIHGFWLGGYRSDESSNSSSRWKWVTGEPWSYTRWAPNQPDNWEGRENKLSILLPDGTWNDVAGDSLPKGYLVEYDSVTSKE